ncbi:MAG: hypothetical protein ACI9JO_000281 [Psychrobacter okhotskensis]|jgi:hypothetical protein
MPYRHIIVISKVYINQVQCALLAIGLLLIGADIDKPLLIVDNR